MEQVQLSIFINQVLNCFYKSKQKTCEELLKLSNREDVELDQISDVYSTLTRLSLLEVRFLQFVNLNSTSIPVTAVENFRQFYSEFTSGRYS
jgi:hypothetical protein